MMAIQMNDPSRFQEAVVVVRLGRTLNTDLIRRALAEDDGERRAAWAKVCEQNARPRAR